MDFVIAMDFFTFLCAAGFDKMFNSETAVMAREGAVEHGMAFMLLMLGVVVFAGLNSNMLPSLVQCGLWILPLVSVQVASSHQSQFL